jgi:hypothetical protein
MKIYESVPQLNKFQKENNEMLKNANQTKFIDKKMIGFSTIKDTTFDPIITRAVQLIAGDDLDLM